jgi:hypothetical protein
MKKARKKARPWDFESYKEALEEELREVILRTDYPMAVAGFLMATLSITVVTAMTFSAFNLDVMLTPPQAAIIFVCFMLSFVGFLMLHRATKRDWI